MPLFEQAVPLLRRPLPPAAMAIGVTGDLAGCRWVVWSDRLT